MKKISILLFLSLVCAIVVIGLGGAGGRFPAVAALLDPVEGLYHNARKALPPTNQSIQIPGLTGRVVVQRDERSVPHIFADHSLDAVTALGYLTAQDRLFQLDFVPRVASGRLSEILGSSMVETDRFLRQTGMLWGAEKNLQRLVAQDSTELALVRAFVKGVNTYLAGLEYADYPLEFKLLGYSPEPYTEMQVLLVLQYMVFDLTYRSDDVIYAELQERLGPVSYEALYPEHSDLAVPIIPEKGGMVKAQDKRDVYTRDGLAAGGSDVLARKHALQQQWAGTPLEGFLEGKGSNNWAVGPERSTTGAPVIAGDMHLALWLPSIWYELHMVTPDMNAYGVTVPGAPLPVEAFNDHVGWAFTNTGSDQIDHLKLTLDESRTKYLYNGAYQPMTLVPDTLRIKGQPPVIDTLYYAHWGPVTISDDDAIALRWVAHDSTRTLQALWNMNRATDYATFQEGISHWDTPMQNIIYGDDVGNIAIRSTGYLPMRKAGHGRGLLDGSTDAFTWTGRVPFDELPHSFNPPQGFLTSTNQEPADSLYPHYLGHDWRSNYRSLRIDALMQGKALHSVEDLKMYQSDVYVVQRDLFVPLLEQVDGLSEEASSLREMLVNWEGVASVDRAEPLVLELYLENLRTLVWDEPAFDSLRNPMDARLYFLLANEIEGPWLDRQGTETVEGGADVMRSAIEQTVAQLQETYGWDSENWRWGDLHKVVFRHFTRSDALQGLWRGPYAFPGFAETLSPARNLTTTHSASWRMVVDFSTSPPTGYGVYPGGQSGNPFSPFYDHHLDTYLKFEHFELFRPASPSEMPTDRITAILEIQPE
ncbi:MAG: penicillin acylase family protein [Bacteroidota bacterium]